jgi:hypothetical protein
MAIQGQQLVWWVMDNVHAGDRWRWTPRVGRPVVLVIHGITSMEGSKSPYYIEFSHFYVVDRGGKEVRSLPGGRVPLPDWFMRAVTQSSTMGAPWYIDADKFAELVNAGVIVKCGRERPSN